MEGLPPHEERPFIPNQNINNYGSISQKLKSVKEKATTKTKKISFAISNFFKTPERESQPVDTMHKFRTIINVWNREDE